jgi:hypothetical protein
MVLSDQPALPVLSDRLVQVSQDLPVLQERMELPDLQALMELLDLLVQV